MASARPAGAPDALVFPSLKRLFAGKPRRNEAAPIALSGQDHEKLRLLLSLVNERSQPNLNYLRGAVENIDLIALNVKNFGYDLARRLSEGLSVPPETSAQRVPLCSKPSTQADLESDWVPHWCRELHIPLLFHRKIWELAYILQALHNADHLRAAARGVGFGCGNEPMASYFASKGVTVTVTDLQPDDSRAQVWDATRQHAGSLERSHHPQLVDRDTFARLAEYRDVDMNAIPDDLRGYDFCWSMCALEHLGSIEHGLAFVERAMKTLRPGGTAVHTTEFNINPLGPTADNWPTVLFQQKHLEALAQRLRTQGHEVAPFDFDPGDKPLDRFIDLPPWHDGVYQQISVALGQPLHLKVASGGMIATCFGLIITKGPDAD